jgi:hypothetical protein
MFRPIFRPGGVQRTFVRSRKPRTDIGKFLYLLIDTRATGCINQLRGKYSVQLWNQPPADALGTLSCKPSSYRERDKSGEGKVWWKLSRNAVK